MSKQQKPLRKRALDFLVNDLPPIKWTALASTQRDSEYFKGSPNAAESPVAANTAAIDQGVPHQSIAPPSLSFRSKSTRFLQAADFKAYGNERDGIGYLLGQRPRLLPELTQIKRQKSFQMLHINKNALHNQKIVEKLHRSEDRRKKKVQDSTFNISLSRPIESPSSQMTAQNHLHNASISIAQDTGHVGGGASPSRELEGRQGGGASFHKRPQQKGPVHKLSILLAGSSVQLIQDQAPSSIGTADRQKQGRGTSQQQKKQRNNNEGQSLLILNENQHFQDGIEDANASIALQNSSQLSSRFGVQDSDERARPSTRLKKLKGFRLNEQSIETNRTAMIQNSSNINYPNGNKKSLSPMRAQLKNSRSLPQVREQRSILGTDFAPGSYDVNYELLWPRVCGLSFDKMSKRDFKFLQSQEQENDALATARLNSHTPPRALIRLAGAEDQEGAANQASAKGGKSNAPVKQGQKNRTKKRNTANINDNYEKLYVQMLRQIERKVEQEQLEDKPLRVQANPLEKFSVKPFGNKFAIDFEKEFKEKLNYAKDCLTSLRQACKFK